MPIPECDPWREQYFAHIPCPPEVIVPTDDMAAWELYPEHRWVYNKLRICETQGIECAPHGVEPQTFPVFSKPIYNLRGMGIGSRVVRDAAELRAVSAPGHLWMRLLEGEHLSTDVAVVRGAAKWWRHARGVGGENGGMFDHWIVHADARPALEDLLGGWLSAHLAEYTGMINFETIGGRIIECHLRFSDQWPDLCGGDPWVRAVVELYAHGRWEYKDAARREGYSVVLWGAHGLKPVALAEELLEQVRALPGVSSVQNTFDAEKPAAEHAMPPGGFRIAIVNCWNLESGRTARALIMQHVFADELRASCRWKSGELPVTNPSCPQISELALELRRFAADRDWDQFHAPRNLAAALSVEAGELLEHFQWLTDGDSRALAADKLEQVRLEMADVLLYLIRLSDQLGVDLIEAAKQKLALNAARYPVESTRGSSRKYTEY